VGLIGKGNPAVVSSEFLGTIGVETAGPRAVVQEAVVHS